MQYIYIINVKQKVYGKISEILIIAEMHREILRNRFELRKLRDLIFGQI